MKTLLAALIAGALTFAHVPALAQEKKSEPTKEEVKKAESRAGEKAEAKKPEKAEAKKDENKKKVKKGGC